MIFKYLFPFDRFVIHSRMLPVEAMQALQATIEPTRLFRFSTTGARVFQGKIDAHGFRIMRIIGYRNSWLPVVVGTITPAPGGSVIRIHMRLLVIVALFSAFWLGAVGFFALSSIVNVLSRSAGTGPAGLGSIGMFAFGLALTNGGFWLEANKQKRTLISLFESP